LASQYGISGKGLEELAQNKDLSSIVLKEMQNTGRMGGLAEIEIIDGVVMAHEKWNPLNVGSTNVCLRVLLGLLKIAIGSHHKCAENQQERHIETVAEGG
jgi:hypothetical protein